MFGTLFSALFLTFSAQAQEPAQKEAKAAWSAEVKSEFIKSCASERPPHIEASVMNNICTCTLNRLEKSHTPSELNSSEGRKKSEEALLSCAVGSKGAWSDIIKNQFMSSCVASKPESLTEENMKKICSCSLNMLESNYAPQEQETEAAIKFFEQAASLCANQLNK